MTEQERMTILVQTGAVKEGHYLLTSSRRHIGRTVQIARLFEHASQAEIIMRDLADSVSDLSVDLVLGPAIGGILPAYELSRILGVRNIFSERENGRMKLHRGYAIEAGAKVLIAEDVITTGGSLREVLQLIRDNGGEPVGIVAVANLAACHLDFGVPLYCAASLATVSYDEEDCPFCKQGIALIRPASRSI